MPTYKEFICPTCSISFRREKRNCRSPQDRTFCSRQCASADSVTRYEASCSECNKVFTRTKSEFMKCENHFCSARCSATFNNRVRKNLGFTTSGKHKIKECSMCSIEMAVSIHVPKSYIPICHDCVKGREIKNGLNLNLHKNICDNCHNEFCTISKKQKFCSRKCINAFPAYKENLSRKATQRLLDGKIKTNGATRCTFLFKGEEIRCDSLLEKSCLTYYTETQDVISIRRCNFSIPFEYEGHIARYIPDFLINTVTNSYIVECKSWIGKNLNEKWRKYLEKSPLKEKALKQYAIENQLEAIWYSPNAGEWRQYYKRIQEEYKASIK